MKTEQFRNLISLFEARNPDITYQDNTGEVVAQLKSYNSQVYTKLAQRLERIEQLESEIKALKDEAKQDTRDDIVDLFDAKDAVNTRVVETISFVFTLSKDPKATEAPKYKEILTALEAHLTPELILVLEELKKKMVTVTQKQPSLKYRSVTEGVGGLFAKLKSVVFNWAQRYDQKLAQLKSQAGIA